MFLLYETCIITQTFFLYMKVYFSLYEMMYNDNKHFSYIREYIMKTNIFVKHESVFLIIRDDV